MAINLLEYAEIWTTTLDLQAKQIATSAWMEANSGQVEYVGGKKVRIPEMYTTGLGDYHRGTGSNNRGKYAKGKVEIKYRDYEVEMDRSAEFSWDRHDVDETAFILQAPRVAGEFQRTQVIPEIDSFRYSRISQLVMEQGASAYKTQTLTAENIYDEFVSQVYAMQNITGIDTANLVATMPFSVKGILAAAAIKKSAISPQTFSQGGLSFSVDAINSISIIPVVEDRMKTEYIFHGGEEAEGFEPAPGARTINWIITPRTLPIAMSKTDNLKVFTPDVNQDGDDWLLQYRKYHDLWILYNQLNQIVLSVQPQEVTYENQKIKCRQGY